MTDQAYLLLFAYLSDLSQHRLANGRMVRGTRFDAARVITGMTRDEMVAMLDRFDAAVAEASAVDTAGWDDPAMHRQAIRIVRQALADEPTGNPADFPGAIPECPDAPGDARDL